MSRWRVNFFLGVIGTLAFGSTKVVISFNNNGSSSLSLPVDVDFN